ncbi:MarR family transcriptional regulator [Arthrobacter sp. I2-34]|uniref:MarR family transcriptional regulator n=1 Tax=Arthrobacter hankyongi TaxID=2904801 RepID=A0ABS9L2S3_9MICC|nr:MarR family transcriptional regulator [Arthrobacter hankyongi]MCG2620974.1 MarR family transcriptional regulator [Arthrobacter hankyongi]
MGVDNETAAELTNSIFALQRQLRSATQLLADPAGPGFALQGVMRIIGEAGELRATELAARLGIGPAGLSRHIAELETAGYVVRRPHPEDGRAFLISLSEQGIEHMRAEVARRSASLQQVLADWTDAEARFAGEVLQRLTASLESALQEMKPGQQLAAATA